MAIVLKNIDTSKVTIAGQINKHDEELQEFYEAFFEQLNESSEENEKHLIEEFLDLMQVNLGLLDKVNISAEKVMQYYPEHLEKIKHRPR